MFKKVLDYIFKLNRLTKFSIQIATDTFLIIFALILAMSLSLNSFLLLFKLEFWYVLFILIPITIFVFVRLGLYRAIIRYMSPKIMTVIALGVFISTSLLFIIVEITNIKAPSIMPLSYFFILVLSVGGIRLILRESINVTKKDNRKKVAIYCAGEAGRQLLKTLNSSF